MSSPDDASLRFHRLVCRHALTGLALLVLVLLVLGLLAGLGTLLLLLEPVLMPVVIAGVLAYLLLPVVEWVQRRVRHRVAAVLLVMGGGGMLLAGLLWTALPPLINQSGHLMRQHRELIAAATDGVHDALDGSELLRNGVDMLHRRAVQEAQNSGLEGPEWEALASAATPQEKLGAVLRANTDYLAAQGLRWLSAGTHALSGVGMLLIGTVMVPVFLFFFLCRSDMIAHNWHSLLPLRDSRFRDELVGTLSEINDYIISFVRGQMLVSAADGVLLAIALRCLGLPYAIPLGAAAALLGIIPYIGMIATWIPAMLIAWMHFQDPWALLWVSLIFGTVSQLDGWVLQPRIVGSRLHMHDMTVMFSVLFWSYVIGGVVGALLAVPLTASLKVLFRRYIWNHARRSETGEQAVES